MVEKLILMIELIIILDEMLIYFDSNLLKVNLAMYLIGKQKVKDTNWIYRFNFNAPNNDKQTFPQLYKLGLNLTVPLPVVFKLINGGLAG